MKFEDFSPKQQKAVLWNKNRELLISAAAGSGKTTVLVERIIKRITEDRIPIDKFLIVTFTNASGKELKEKITEAIEAKLRENPEDEWLELQAAGVSKAAIGTMHSFCLNVTKENHEHPCVNLPKKITILENNKREELFNEALDEVLAEEYAKKEKAFIRLLDMFATFKDDDSVRTYIRSIYDTASENVDPEEWLSRAGNADNTKEMQKEVASFIASQAEEISLLCKDFIRTYSVEDNKFGQATVAVAEIFSQYAKELRNENYTQAREIYSTLPQISFYGAHKGENVIPHKKLLHWIYKQFVPFSFDEAAQDAQTAEVTKKLADITLNVYNVFAEKKRKARSADFNDLEHWTLKLFEDKTVADMYAERFSHILFDEYQDCNRLQEAIMQRICKKARYFMVGDVKQSIYEFRQADPQLFLKKYNSYQSDENADLAKIELNENYRSRANILNATNLIFFSIMKKRFCGMDYNSENALNSSDAVYPAGDEHTFENAPVTVVLAKEEGSSTGTVHAEMLFIVREIKRLMQSAVVYDAKNKAYRRIGYGDFAILSREMSGCQSVITGYLAKANIPYSTDSKADMSYAPEINLLLSMLRAIENPYDDMSVLTVMHSYIFGITDKELFSVMQTEGEDESVLSKATALGQVCTDGTLRQKLEYFVATFDKWIKRQEYMSVSDFIDTILYETAYCEYFGALDNGQIRIDNVNKFCQTVKSRIKTYQGGMAECAALLDSIDKKSFTVPDTSAPKDVVSVQTIHKSKGLEYPVVFLIQCDKKFKSREENVLIHSKYGVALTTVDTENKTKTNNSDYDNMLFLRKKSVKEEEQRLLYVAMTRAREKLYLLGKEIKPESENVPGTSLSINNSDSFFKFVMPVLYGYERKLITDKDADLPGDTVLNFDVAGTTYKSTWEIKYVAQCTDENGRKYAIIDGEKINAGSFSGAETMPVKEQTAENTEKTVSDFDPEKLTKRMLFDYPYEPATKLVSKLSVSQIKRIAEKRELTEDDDVPLYRKEPVRITVPDGERSASELGTLYHFFMQHLTLKAPYTTADFENDVNAMLSKELISQSDVKYLNYYKFAAFFKSPVGEEIAASKVEREKNFSYMLSARSVYPEMESDEKILIQGVIDCLARTSSGEYVLVDYKTDKVAQGGEDVLVRRHSGQIKLYADAISAIEKIKITRKYIYSFALERFIELK